jgi:hypothetical protein
MLSSKILLSGKTRNHDPSQYFDRNKRSAETTGTCLASVKFDIMLSDLLI